MEKGGLASPFHMVHDAVSAQYPLSSTDTYRFCSDPGQEPDRHTDPTRNDGQFAREILGVTTPPPAASQPHTLLLSPLLLSNIRQASYPGPLQMATQISYKT